MTSYRKVHFIAIGGSIMHSLAIDLHRKGVQVSGSDDEVFEPSRSRLAQYGLLPATMGWDPSRIRADLDAVIVGMHAKKDNPELMKARELGLALYSFPEFIYKHAEDKQRIVVAGSHGKTTITAMVMHVLHQLGRPFDYVIGASVEGFDNNIRLSEEAPLIIIEGDEYPAAPIAPKPKFLYYNPHIILISGIAWDHANVYPTLDDYVRQFEKLADKSVKAGALIYNDEDPLTVTVACAKERPDVSMVPYTTHPYRVVGGHYELLAEGRPPVPLLIFGRHNMSNIEAARRICQRIGITEDQFYKAIASFKGAQRRLQLVEEGHSVALFNDFAHAPSKVAASIQALRERNPDRRLVACLELHTYSSLSTAFLPQYQNSMKEAHVRVVYFNPEKLRQKGYNLLNADYIRQAFNDPELHVFQDRQSLQSFLEKHVEAGTNVLLMSSGNFDNLDIQAIGKRLCINLS